MPKERESNIELLRCLSMFLILVIHANFVSLPRIGTDELVSDTIGSVTRFFIESVGIVAVNTFVMISGWFGIVPRKDKVLALVFTVLWYGLGAYLLFIILGRTSISWAGLADVFQLTPRDWFIKSYFLLMIISPVLNAFSRNAEEKTHRYVVLAFFLFEAVFGWIAGGKRFFVSGYGPLHLMGLYLAAQYIHNQLGAQSTPKWLQRLFGLPKAADLALFFLFAAINTAMVSAGSYFTGKAQKIFDLVYAYSNPLTILGAIYLLLFFSKLEMPRSKIINRIGASCFAVYLVHTEPHIREQVFSPQVQYLYGHSSGIACIGSIFLFLCLIFAASVLIDQLRILVWKGLSFRAKS